jgi:TonB family protein
MHSFERPVGLPPSSSSGSRGGYFIGLFEEIMRCSMSWERKQSIVAAVAAVLMITLFDVVVLAQQTAPQPEVPEQPPTGAPSPSPSPAIAKWQQALVTRLARFQRYPKQAGGAGGIVSLGFSIDRQGRVVDSRIVKSSGSAVLDAEAQALVKRASPFPPPPAEVPDADLSFVVPIRYTAGE